MAEVNWTGRSPGKFRSLQFSSVQLVRCERGFMCWLRLAIFRTDCVNESCVGEKPGGGSAGLLVEGRGESLSGSTTDDQPTDETNLLPSAAAADDDCFIPVVDFPLDIIRPVENLGQGLFGEVPFRLTLSRFRGIDSFGWYNDLRTR